MRIKPRTTVTYEAYRLGLHSTNDIVAAIKTLPDWDGTEYEIMGPRPQLRFHANGRQHFLCDGDWLVVTSDGHFTVADDKTFMANWEAAQ